ncbi:hypothetical protein U8V72_10990 [Priestia filamentosa]|uniref:hypothetical protein n=1 Tax=Priestia filamentosa TaxID=1402861 RepID=UPI00397A2006
MKNILNNLKQRLIYIWDVYRLQFYIGIGILIALIILSFFIDIGYIFTIIAVIALIQFSKKVSKEDPDVLKIEENERKKDQQEFEEARNELLKELDYLKQYIEENPTDFVAWRRKAEIEEVLKETE